MSDNKTLEQIRDKQCEQIADAHMAPYKFCNNDNATVYDITYFCAQDGFDASTAIHQERTKKLVDKIWKVKCTGPNQKEVLADLYKMAEEISQEWEEYDSKD